MTNGKDVKLQRVAAYHSGQEAWAPEASRPGWHTLRTCFMLSSISTVPTSRSSVTPRGICTNGASRILRTGSLPASLAARPSCGRQRAMLQLGSGGGLCGDVRNDGQAHPQGGAI